MTSEGSLVGAPEDPAEEAKPAPAAPTATVDENGNVKLTFGNFDSTWQGKVSAVKVNDTTYTKYDWVDTPGENQYEWQESKGQGIDTLYLDKNSFNTGDNTVVISAEGYEDLTVTVNIAKPEEPDTPNTQPAPTAPTATVDDNGNVTLAFNNLDSTWQGKITSIKVNDQEYSKFDGSYPSKPGNNEYDWQYGSQGQELYLDKTSFNTGDNTVVISAEGYEDLTVKVNITKPAEPATCPCRARATNRNGK